MKVIGETVENFGDTTEEIIKEEEIRETTEPAGVKTKGRSFYGNLTITTFVKERDFEKGEFILGVDFSTDKQDSIVAFEIEDKKLTDIFNKSVNSQVNRSGLEMFLTKGFLKAIQDSIDLNKFEKSLNEVDEKFKAKLEEVYSYEISNGLIEEKESDISTVASKIEEVEQKKDKKDNQPKVIDISLDEKSNTGDIEDDEIPENYQPLKSSVKVDEEIEEKEPSLESVAKLSI